MFLRRIILDHRRLPATFLLPVSIDFQRDYLLWKIGYLRNTHMNQNGLVSEIITILKVKIGIL